MKKLKFSKPHTHQRDPLTKVEYAAGETYQNVPDDEAAAAVKAGAASYVGGARASKSKPATGGSGESRTA